MSPSTMLRTLAAALFVTAACGDPLLTADGRGDPIFAVTGEVHDPSQLAAADAVAVVFTRFVLRDADHPTQSVLQIEAIPGEISGRFPAGFRVELMRPPHAFPWDGAGYGLIGGGTLPVMFATDHAPDRVRIGHLAIGPSDEIYRLPSEIPFGSANVRTMGELIAPYLPHTTVTGYQVIYAEGVDHDDTAYPGQDGGQRISEGFSLVDARGFFSALVWQTCASDRYAATYALPAYQACITANRALIDCLHACVGAACVDGCRRRYPGQVDSQACLDDVAQLEQQCGPAQRPTTDQVHVLRDGARLSVVLGQDDITDGLWFQHVSEVE